MAERDRHQIQVEIWNLEQEEEDRGDDNPERDARLLELLKELAAQRVGQTSK